MIPKILAFVALFCGFSFFTSQSAFAGTTLLFSTEESLGVTADSYALDKDDSAATNVDLTFGNGATNYLRFNKSSVQFEFNQNLSLGGKELKSFRVENAASGGTCDTNAKGKMFYDTDDNKLYLCNGTTFVVPSAVPEADSITGAMLAAAVAGAGLVQDGSDNLAVNVDNSTIEINTDTVRVKAGGIGANEIGADAVAASELANNAVDSAAIATGAVTSGKIGTGGVSNANQFATGVVDAASILDGTIAIGDLAERNATVVITPEYHDYSFNPDGANNVGTMESGFDSAANKNFYNWYTKNTSTMQDYDIVVQWHIPENFTGWQASDQIQIDYKTDTTTATDNKINLTLKDSADSAASLTGGTDLKSSVADTWISSGNVSFSGGTWTAGGILTLTVKLSSKATGAADFNPAYVGSIKFNIKVK